MMNPSFVVIIEFNDITLLFNQLKFVFNVKKSNMKSNSIFLFALILTLSFPVCAQTLEQANAQLKRKEYRSAYSSFRKLAEQGNSQAWGTLGWMYINGIGVSSDNTKGISWLKRAAEQGNIGAQLYLGGIFLSSTVQPKDVNQSAFWYRKAAEQGDPIAQLKIGELYAKGEGVERDLQEAMLWIHRSATQGNIDAQVVLGGAYMAGEEYLKINNRH
ncbi:MAG: hypothetical protein CFE38_02755 [Comamonadaceae bacterium PBBC1]|nr:MAG: hypothetical protein CFE38_02755 [Comamonadaceae bacterium PBBC1]